jgi:hydrogenase 3 maturation protease
MKELAKLKNRLQGKVLIVGMGNPLRGDDGAGPELIKKLKGSSRLTHRSLFLLDVGEVPENYLGKMVKEKPNTIVLIDAIELATSPGTIKIIEKDDIRDEFLSTHNVSLKLIAKYLEKESFANVFLLGIQPKSTEFGKEISRSVREGLEKVVRVLERT